MQYYSNPPVTSSDADEVALYLSIVQGWDGFPGLDSKRLVVGKPYSSHVNGYEPMSKVTTKILEPLVDKFGQDFGGFMAWEFNQDEGGAWADAVHQTLSNSASPR